MVPAPIASVLKHFREEVESHIRAARMSLPAFAPANKLPSAYLRPRRESAGMSASQLVELTDRRAKVSVPAGTTVFDAARANDIAIPTLCHQQNESPVGVCRVCVVDVGARVFAASCMRPVEPGMVVNTASERVKRARHTLVELLMADHPSVPARANGSPAIASWKRSPSRKTLLSARYAPRATRRGTGRILR